MKMIEHPYPKTFKNAKETKFGGKGRLGAS